MNSAETVSVEERIKRLVNKAAAFVTIEEYWQIRATAKISNDEAKQLAQVVKTINKRAETLKRSFDPMVIGSRSILKQVPLPQYLQARKEILITAIFANNRRVAHFEETVGYETQLEASSAYGIGLSQQLDLTHAVMQAVGI